MDATALPQEAPEAGLGIHPILHATYDAGLGQGALVARNQSHPDWVRIFGVSGLQVRVARWATGFDYRQLYETTNVSQVPNDTSASGASRSDT